MKGDGSFLAVAENENKHDLGMRVGPGSESSPDEVFADVDAAIKSGQVCDDEIADILRQELVTGTGKNEPLKDLLAGLADVLS
jgi:hypothetical protein